MINKKSRLTRQIIKYLYSGKNFLAEEMNTLKVFLKPVKEQNNEEQIISGCPIDGAISVQVDDGFGSYRWFVYITTLCCEVHPGY